MTEHNTDDSEDIEFPDNFEELQEEQSPEEAAEGADAGPTWQDRAVERGTRYGNAIGAGLGGLAATGFVTLVNILPVIRGKLFHKMAIKSIENYHGVAGGDAVGINAKAGQQLELEPVAYRAPEELEKGERPGWRAKGRDKTWDAAADGQSVNYLGRTPTVLLQDDDHVEAGWLAPRVGQAIELDNYWPLFTDAEINAVIDYQGAGQPGQARADGGATVDLELDSPGEWAQENVVDLNSGEGHDGMRISTKKAREWRAEHTDSEQMQQQEDRGYLMGLAKGEEGPGIVKLLLICAAIILGTLAVIFMGPELVGGDSVTGGGGINPLMSTLSAVVG